MNRSTVIVAVTLVNLCLVGDVARACMTPPVVTIEDTFHCVLRGFYQPGDPYLEIRPVPANGYAETPILGWYWDYEYGLWQIDQEDLTGFTTGWSHAWFSSDTVGIYEVGAYARNEAGWSQPASAYLNVSDMAFSIDNSFLQVNDDDDDENGMPDWRNTEPMGVTDDELTAAYVYADPGGCDRVNMYIWPQWGDVAVWADKTRTTQMLAAVSYDMYSWDPCYPNAIDQTIYLEGTDPSDGTSGSDPWLYLDYLGGQSEPLQGWDPAVAWLTVVKVDLRLDGVADDALYGPTQEIIPGGFIGVDEFRELTVYNMNPSNCQASGGGWIQNWGDMHLSIPSGSARIQVWNATKTAQINLSQPISPGTYFVKGVQASSSWRDVTLRLTHDYTGFVDDIKLTVYGVTEVRWEPYPGNAWPTQGDLRIFPEKYTPSDQAPFRDRVDIKATIKPALSGITVYFRCFDVDDPSTSCTIDTYNLPGVQSGPDNCGGLGTFVGQASDETNVNGEAYATMTVTKNPGDNFRIVASTDSARLESVTQQMADGLCTLPDWARMSSTLTVWRKLHIEFDTMIPPPDTSVFGTVVANASRITATGVEVTGTNWEHYALVGGVLDPDGTSPGKSVDFVSQQTFEVNGNTPNLATVTTDYDHDQFDNDGANGRDDAGEVFNMSSYAANPANVQIGINTDDPATISAPGASDAILGMNGYYNEAYIQVEEQTSGNTHATFDFNRNTSGQLATADVPGDGSYWCVCVGWGYEGANKKAQMCPNCTDHSYYSGDDDPEDEGVPPHHMGVTVGLAGGIPSETCMVYCESIRDVGGNANILKTVAHEVGHCLGLEHSRYNPATGFESSKDGIMGWQPAEIPCYKAWADLYRAHTIPDRFSDYHMHQLRTDARE